MTSTIIPCELWHIRLPHIHYKALPIVSKVVIGLPEIQIDHEGVCKGCARGKNTKNPYPNNENKENGILDIIHSYICGPMQTTSLSGHVYYASFINDYSHKTWIYFLKKKDEVFERFKQFKALVENLFEKRIKILRSDNGGEFNEYCKEARIKKKITIPYNPQQNGVEERNNRSIMEFVRAMIHDQYLPMYMWAEAARTIVYVHNRISPSSLQNKTP